MALEQELRTFQNELPDLLQDVDKRGKYALVHKDTVDSVWPTVDDALAAGYDRFGIEPFMVKEITEHEKPQRFSRRVTRCP